MRVLAFDTCLGSVSVALGRQAADGSWQIIERAERRETGHAERLMPLIADVLAEAGMAFGDVDRLAVTLGPGTFTGVRTAIAAARAFRLASRVEVVGVTTLAALARRAVAVAPALGRGRGGPLFVAIDARRGKLYCALFAAVTLEPMSPPAELAPLEAGAVAASHAATIVGSGAALVAGAGGTLSHTAAVGPVDIEPSAADLVVLAPALAPLESISPIYLRPPDAKPQAGKSLARAP
jgi:tRNA threonylcarbamoyl adenosine modification protein YeaZ